NLTQLLRQSGIGYNNFNLCVIDNMTDLVIHQLLIQGSKNRALAGRRKHDLEVLCAVPQQRPHSFIAGNTQIIMQSMGECRGTSCYITKSGLFCCAVVSVFASPATMPSSHYSVGVHGGAVS